MGTPAPHKALQSRLEVNFLRVLRETQQMANGTSTPSWSFDKQVRWLHSVLQELETSPCPPSAEMLQSSKRQLLKLGGVRQAEVQVESEAAPLVSEGAPLLPEAAPLPQLLQRRASSRPSLRHQLLGGDGGDGGAAGEVVVGGAESRLASDEQRRERLLSDMLLLTRQWKDQSSTAAKVIKRDLQTLDQSSNLASSNEAALKTEAERLAALNKRACNCWIWLMLVLVCCVFISMVLFIRIFPKRRVLVTE